MFYDNQEILDSKTKKDHLCTLPEYLKTVNKLYKIYYTRNMKMGKLCTTYSLKMINKEHKYRKIKTPQKRLFKLASTSKLLP